MLEHRWVIGDPRMEVRSQLVVNEERALKEDKIKVHCNIHMKRCFRRKRATFYGQVSSLVLSIEDLA